MKKLITLLFITQLSFSQTPITNKVLIPFRDKNSWGLSDTLGRIVVKPFAKEIPDFLISDDGKFLSRYVIKTNKSYYVIDKNKKVLLPEANTYDSIRVNKFNPNHFMVFKKGKKGIFYKLKEVVPCLYDDVQITSNDSYEVTIGELSGLINSLGKLIIPVEYLRIHRSWEDEDDKNAKFVWVAEGMLVEKKFYDTKIESNSGFPAIGAADKVMGTVSVEEEIDYSAIQNELLKKYEKVEISQRFNVARIQKEGKQGMVDIMSNEEIILPIYEEVIPYDRDRNVIVYKVKKNGKYGLVKSGNRVLLECEFDAINDDQILIKDNKQGYIVFNTIYPYIKPKYQSIKSAGGIPINNNWQFGLFEVTTENGKGLVGENGVEFFRD